MASKTDAAVKLVLVFFISLLSFSIGTFVGKKYSDNQHQLAALEPQKSSSQHREVASVHGEESAHGSEQQKPGAMTDEEIAKLAEEFVADEDTTTAGHDTHATATGGHGESTHGETASHAEPGTKAPTAHKAGHLEPSTAAHNVAVGKTPASETKPQVTAPQQKQEERRPSSLPPNVAQYTVGKFTVQVASFATEVEAQKKASELKDKGYSAFYIPANVKGKTWYRVSVGQFATQREAISYRSEFMSKAKVESAIVQKITE